MSSAERRRFLVGPSSELPPGSSQAIDVAGREVAVFNVDGDFHAVQNVCPHHGAPLCAGLITGRMAPSSPHQYEYVERQQILRCPWHGYEFRFSDGKSPLDPDHYKLTVYEVEVEDDDVVVYL